MVNDPAGLRRPMTPQADGRVVLRLVDHDVAVGERRADEQRAGLVDEQLIRSRPPAALAGRPVEPRREEAADESDRLLRRPRLAERGA